MTQSFIQKAGILSLLGGMLIGLAVGCGSHSRAYTPSSPSAREALEAALSAWKTGEKPGSLATKSPPVHPVDFQWEAGQVIEKYEILQEEPGEPEKRFSVKLTMKKPQGEKQVGYVVVGRDPVWVYRDEDYTRFMNMDNNPKPAQARRGR